MKCPYCDAEMEEGFIQSRDTLGWSAKMHFFGALAGVLSDIELGRSVPSMHCPSCQKIIIEYEGYLP